MTSLILIVGVTLIATGAAIHAPKPGFDRNMHLGLIGVGSAVIAIWSNVVGLS